MEAVFFKAANPVRAVCLGASLQPLTIGHLFLLRKFVPDILDQEEIDFGSLAVAAFICASPQSKVERWICRKDGKPRGLAVRVFKFWSWFKTWDLLAERERFDTYRRESLEPPNYWRDITNPLKSCQSPLELRLLAMLMSEFQYTEADAMDMPITKANALWATLAEQRGKIDFADDRQKGFLEFAARMDAERLAKLNEGN